jgi:hypothetical protein
VLGGVPTGSNPPSPYPAQAPSLKLSRYSSASLRRAPVAGLLTAVFAALVLAAPPIAGAPFHVESSPRALEETGGYGVNFNISLISLPNFNPLTTYLHNYRSQYPTYDFAGKYAGGLVYIDNFSRFVYFNPYSGATQTLSAAVTLLYQQTPGLSAQIDNEFQLDTPYDVALLYGNLTTSPGNLTVETVSLSNGSIRQVTTGVQMENDVQADYLGGGLVAVFNSTGIRGYPTYLVNVYNGTSWAAGPQIGIAADNVYWVQQFNSFFNVQGTHLSQFKLEGASLVQVAQAYFNSSAVTSISAVDGSVYNPGQQQLAFDLATNDGDYIEVAHVPGGLLHQAGSYAYLSNLSWAVQRYVYTSQFIWTARQAFSGPTVLFDPFDNETLTAPNLVGRQEGSGANGNFEFTNPYAYTTYVSLNASQIGKPSLAPNQFLWAWSISGQTTSTGLPSTAIPTLFGVPDWIWVLGGIIVAAVAVYSFARGLRA